MEKQSHLFAIFVKFIGEKKSPGDLHMIQNGDHIQHFA